MGPPTNGARQPERTTTNECTAGDLRADIYANAAAYTDRSRADATYCRGRGERDRPRDGYRERHCERARRHVGQTYGVTYRSVTNVAGVSGDRLEIGDALSELFLDSETALTSAGRQAIRPTPSRHRSTNGRTTRTGGANRRSGNRSHEWLSLRGTALAVTAGRTASSSADSSRWSASPPERMPFDGTVSLAAVSWPNHRRRWSNLTFERGGPHAGTDADAEYLVLLLTARSRYCNCSTRTAGGSNSRRSPGPRLDGREDESGRRRLRDEGELEAFRIGRENVVTLPDTDVTVATAVRASEPTATAKLVNKDTDRCRNLTAVRAQIAVSIRLREDKLDRFGITDASNRHISGKRIIVTRSNATTHPVFWRCCSW